MFCTRHCTGPIYSRHWKTRVCYEMSNPFEQFVTEFQSSVLNAWKTQCVHSVRVVVVCIFYRIFLFLSSLNLGFDVCKWLTLYVIRDKFQTGVYEKILHPFIPFHRREFYKGLLLCLFSQWLCVMCGFVCVLYAHTL